ncbi:MAG: hypothetical protein ABEL76_01430 [Bradymonadaceae bacterium]
MADRLTDIYLELSGDDVSPRTVRVRTLLRILGGLESALVKMGEEMEVEFGEHEALLMPKSFERSSLAVRSDVSPRARKPLERIDEAVHGGNTADLPPDVNEQLGEVQSAVGERGATLDIRGDELELQGMSITEDTPVVESSEEDVEERTSHGVVYGECIRINRSRGDAAILLHDGARCRLTGLDDEQLRTLMRGSGDDLEQIYRIEGRATWNVADYQITSMDPVSIDPIERDAGALFDGLREATNGNFDETNPVEYVENLRGK